MMDLAGEMLQIQLFNALVHRECSTQSLRASFRCGYAFSGLSQRSEPGDTVVKQDVTPASAPASEISHSRKTSVLIESIHFMITEALSRHSQARVGPDNGVLLQCFRQTSSILQRLPESSSQTSI